MKLDKTIKTLMALIFLASGFSMAAVEAQELSPPYKNVPSPTYANVAYGDYNKLNGKYNPKADFNLLDLWLADSNKPTPLVIYIHGGGFYRGSKEAIDKLYYRKYDASLVQLLLDAGISVATLNYRLIDRNHPEWAYTQNWREHNSTTPAPMLDAARAIQFLRYYAGRYNLDRERFALMGGSAGGVISAWLAFHEDLADPKAADPLLRESTRVSCVAPWQTPFCLDPRETYIFHPEAHDNPEVLRFYGINPQEFDLGQADQYDLLFQEASPLNHLSSDDPPVFMYYLRPLYTYKKGESGAIVDIHNPIFGVYTESLLQQLQIPSRLIYRFHQDSPLKISQYQAVLRMREFFIRYLN